MPLVPEIKTLLLWHKQQIEENKNILKNQYVMKTSEYVCVRETGELIKPDGLSSGFRKMLNKNSEVIKKIRLHDLRHTIRKFISIKKCKPKTNKRLFTTSAICVRQNDICTYKVMLKRFLQISLQMSLQWQLTNKKVFA